MMQLALSLKSLYQGVIGNATPTVSNECHVTLKWQLNEDSIYS